MKIAYFLDIPDGLGGAGNLLLNQAALMSTTNDVLVVIPCNDKGIINLEYEKRCRRNSLKYVGMQYSTAFEFTRIRMDKLLPQGNIIIKFLRENNVDLVHSVQLNPTLEFAARTCQIPNLMSIYQIQEYQFENDYGNIYPQFHLCDSIIFSDVWKRHLNMYSRCIRPVAITDRIVVKEKRNLQSINFVMLGSVCERKNQLSAIEAINSISDEYNIHLAIVGAEDTNYADRCRDYIKRHRLSTKVKLCGFVSEINEILSESDVILCTSTSESFPSSIVEALSYDLTVVSTPVAGVPEIFRDGFNSYISEGYSMDDIAKKITQCLNDYSSGNIEKIEGNATKTWEENFSREHVKSELSTYYAYICKHYKNESLSDFYYWDKRINDCLNLYPNLNSCSAFLQNNLFCLSLLEKISHMDRVLIWGAGKFGKELYEVLCCMDLKSRIIGFADKSVKGTYLGKSVIEPKKICDDDVDGVILSFRADKQEAIVYLNEKGIDTRKIIIS